MADEAASLRLEVNWQKTKIQALGRTAGVPLTVTVKGHEVTVAEEFVYLGSLIHSSVQSTHDINPHSAIARAAMQSLDNQIWRSRVSTSMELKLYNTCILPIFLCGSDCWALKRTDARKIDAFDQWCLRMLLGIKWHQFDRNHEIQRLTDNPNSLANGTTQTHCSKLTAIVQSRRLTLFGHIARMDGNIDAKRILSTLSPED